MRKLIYIIEVRRSYLNKCVYRKTFLKPFMTIRLPFASIGVKSKALLIQSQIVFQIVFDRMAVKKITSSVMGINIGKSHRETTGLWNKEHSLKRQSTEQHCNGPRVHGQQGKRGGEETAEDSYIKKKVRMWSQNSRA